MESIKISIIVPIYNVEKYIKKCVQSICAQTYTNLEIILVDDGSTDRCGEICDWFAKHDSRIKVIHKVNGGLVSARQAGAQVATGGYITNVDGDDWIENDRIENLVHNGITNDFDMIYMSGWVKEYENRVEIQEFNTPLGEFYSEDIYPMLASIDYCFERHIIPSLVNWAVEKSLYKKIQMRVDPRLTMGEDQVFVWLCLLDANKVNIIADSKYHYVQRSNSYTKTANKNNYHFLQLGYDIIRESLQEHFVDEVMYKRLDMTFIRLMSGTAFEPFIDCEENYLFPYPKVKKNSRIVIYGAGDNGRRIVSAIQKTKKYSIAGWVDKNLHGRSLYGVEINDIEDILMMEFDYIVIAIVDYAVVRNVQQFLVSIGIDDEKIACMNAKVISSTTVRKCFAYDK